MSFRSLIILILVVLLIVKSAFVTWVIFNATNSAVQKLATGQITASLDSVAQQVESLFDPCDRILFSLTNQFKTEQDLLENPQDLAAKLATVLGYEKGITWLSFGFADGSFAGASCKDGKISITVSNHANQSATSWKIAGNNLEDKRKDPEFENFDARARPWFQSALEKSGPVWTKPYQFVSGGRGISYSLAYRDRENRLIGVLAIDFTLEEITRYLGQLEKDWSCEAIVFLKNGQLLAPEQTNHSDTLATEVLALLGDNQKKKELFKDKGRIVEEFRSKGQRLIIGLRTIQIVGDMDCLSAVVYNRDQKFGSIENSLRQSAALSVVALIISLVAGTMLAKLVSTPLQSLTQQVVKIGRFELDSLQLPKSLIREIRILSESLARMRDSLKSFAHYVPVHIVRDLVKTGGVASLGGEQRLISILFCDIEGFTGYAEKVPPAQAVNTLTHYFDIFGNEIHAEGGVIDKFLGDGMMALFNAPSPLTLHAKAACRAAIAAQQKLRQNNNPAPLRVRIGLHTGVALVGNVGTQERFSYTAIGDGVNLCSRLEGLNKIYGTSIITSSDTAAAAGDADFVWRKLDRVAVVGRSEPLEIYELLGLKSDVSAELLKIAEIYPQALAAYFLRNFEKAKTLLAKISEMDTPSRILLNRISELEMKDLDASWNGVFKATSK